LKNLFDQSSVSAAGQLGSIPIGPEETDPITRVKSPLSASPIFCWKYIVTTNHRIKMALIDISILGEIFISESLSLVRANGSRFSRAAKRSEAASAGSACWAGGCYSFTMI
jgi:hypothetical protein